MTVRELLKKCKTCLPVISIYDESMMCVYTKNKNESLRECEYFDNEVDSIWQIDAEEIRLKINTK